MIRIFLLLWVPFLGQQQAEPPNKPSAGSRPLDRSAYFAFVDHDYIFTLEIVNPGVPLLNFVSLAEEDMKLMAKDVRLILENRKAPGKVFEIETGDISQPMDAALLTIHPKTSFGARLIGDFDNVKEALGVSIQFGQEELKLAPLTNYDFEILVLKINRINLGSPDFSQDWQVLRLDKLGSRSASSPRKRLRE
jgi:hypothetical protein